MGRRRQADDMHALRELLCDDFAGIGPHGLQLDEQQRLTRYSSGNLVNTTFTVDETTVRTYGAAAIAIGVQTQQAAYQDHPVDGRFRLTAVLVNIAGGWEIGNVQLWAVAGS